MISLVGWPKLVKFFFFFFYASIVAQRLVQYTEQQDLRSPTQAGFRPEHSTIHQTFVLQHVIDRHRRLKSPLYLCFVDLKSAYDRVQWQMLLDLLRRLGVQGTVLGAIQSLCDGCLLPIRVNGVTGDSQTPSMGLQQGCPLSATLASSLMACTTTWRLLSPRLESGESWIVPVDKLSCGPHQDRL